MFPCVIACTVVFDDKHVERLATLARQREDSLKLYDEFGQRIEDAKCELELAKLQELRTNILVPQQNKVNDSIAAIVALQNEVLRTREHDAQERKMESMVNATFGLYTLMQSILGDQRAHV